MHSLIAQIDIEIERYSLLKHDFYRLWQEGRLTLDHLAGYSKEYFQLVKAVPLLVENALRANKVKKYEEQSNLVYQVKPLPDQILNYVWDYGVLKPKDEYKYIKIMAKIQLKIV